MKIIPTALALCLSVVPLASTVAAPVEQLLKFKTVLPADDFTIKPTTPWPASTVVTEIVYDKVNDTFTPYTNELSVTSTLLDVTAKLEKSPILVSGTNSIQVAVPIGSQLMLSTSARQFHTKGSAEVKYPLNIIPSGKGHPAGTYTDDVVLIFDGV